MRIRYNVLLFGLSLSFLCCGERAKEIKSFYEPETIAEKISIKYDSVSIDTMIFLMPADVGDSTCFTTLEFGSSDNQEQQNRIWELKKVRDNRIAREGSIKYWFTWKISETDSVKDIGLFWESKNEPIAKEVRRFRFDKKSKSAWVSYFNILGERKFIDLNKWAVDTVPPN